MGEENWGVLLHFLRKRCTEKLDSSSSIFGFLIQSMQADWLVVLEI
jgi:hypothetical protein